MYAHGRLDNTMFGSLKYVFENKWYENKDNHIIKTWTENQNNTWEIFSVYHIPVTDDYMKINFESDDDFIRFVDMIKNRSFYNFNVAVSSKDNIISLSTCYNNDSRQRLVIHGKLVN